MEALAAVGLGDVVDVGCVTHQAPTLLWRAKSNPRAQSRAAHSHAHTVA